MKKLIPFLCFLSFAFAYAQDETQLKSKVRHSIDELKEFVAIPNDALEHADINRNILHAL